MSTTAYSPTILDTVARGYDAYILRDGFGDLETFSDLSDADEYMETRGLIPLSNVDGFELSDAYQTLDWPDGTWLVVYVTLAMCAD